MIEDDKMNSIIKYPNQMLRKTINRFNLNEINSELINVLAKLMYENNGVGISANQVGLDNRFFIYDVGDGPVCILNPYIIYRSSDMLSQDEGCLSLNGVTVSVKRPALITLKYLDIDNHEHTENFTGEKARVFQHEIDHLDGKLIIDYLSAYDKERAKKFLAKNKNNIKDNKINNKTNTAFIL